MVSLRKDVFKQQPHHLSNFSDLPLPQVLVREVEAVQSHLEAQEAD